MTINTIKGLYLYTRLPFGVDSAPSIFLTNNGEFVSRSKTRMCILMNVYIDVFVIGTTEAEHIANVEEVLKRLQTAGMKQKKNVCF